MTDPTITTEELYKLPPYARMPYMEYDDSNNLCKPPFPDDPADPCYGCGNWYGPCVWPCFRQMGYDKFPKQT